VHVIFREEECFRSIHVLHVAVSYLVLIVFLLITLLAISLHFENRYTKDPTAK
jgi:uncharacterized protein YoxC